MTTSKKDLIRLRKLKNLHCFFLLIFSGAEFTLSFATFDVLDYSNLQNGKLLGSVGILSALLQGGYVRKAAKTQGGSIKLIRNGLMSCCIALSCLALSPYAEKNPMPLLAVLSASLAYTSASVVNSLNAEASKACAEASRGKEMGKFRSAGQLGRAVSRLLYFVDLTNQNADRPPFVCLTILYPRPNSGFQSLAHCYAIHLHHGIKVGTIVACEEGQQGRIVVRRL